MPFLRTRRARSASAVAHVAPDRVTWCEPTDGRLLYATIELENNDPVAVASAIHRARREAGSKNRRCVLALGAAFAPDRILQLPKELSRKELRGLLERKATTLLKEKSGAAEEPTALYHAWAGGQRSDRDSEAMSWHLVAMDQDFVTRLGLALRSRNYRVQHVSAMQLAPLAAVTNLTGNTGEPVLYVVFYEDRMDVGLIVENNVLTRRTMEGNPTTNATVATGLFHELRGIAGYWRKTSRGGTIERVVLIGLQPERAELLANGVAGVLGNAEVTQYPAADDPLSEDENGRAARISCALYSGPLSPNLQCKLPARRVVVGLSAILAGLGALAVGLEVSDDLNGSLHSVVRDNTEMVTLATDLRPDDTRLRVVKKDAEALQTALERTARIGSYAPPLRQVLTESLAALPENADFTSLRMFDSGESNYQFEIQGVIRGSSGDVLRGMRQLRDRLSTSRTLTDIRPTLLDRLPENERVGQPFQLLARCRRNPG